MYINKYKEIKKKEIIILKIITKLKKKILKIKNKHIKNFFFKYYI